MLDYTDGCWRKSNSDVNVVVYIEETGWDNKRMGSYEYVVGGGVGHVEYLEESRSQDHEEEDAEQPGTNLRGLLLLLNLRKATSGLRDLSRLAF